MNNNQTIKAVELSVVYQKFYPNSMRIHLGKLTLSAVSFRFGNIIIIKKLRIN